MQVVAQSSQFAIKWQTDMHQSRYPWMFGYFYLLVGDFILGKPNEMETLNAILACSGDWQNLTKTDCPHSLFLMPTLPAFLNIEFAFYGLEHLQSIVPMDFEPTPLGEISSCRFDAGESSDSYKLYVLARNGTVRLLFNVLCSEPREVIISASEFDSVVATTVRGMQKDFQILKEAKK